MKRTLSLDEFGREMQRLSARLERISSRDSIPVDKLLTPSFMSRRTCFSSFAEMIEESPFRIDSEQNFESIADSDWDDFVDDNTSFTTWDEMLSTAATEWFEAQIDAD